MRGTKAHIDKALNILDDYPMTEVIVKDDKFYVETSLPSDWIADLGKTLRFKVIVLNEPKVDRLGNCNYYLEHDGIEFYGTALKIEFFMRTQKRRSIAMDDTLWAAVLTAAHKRGVSTSRLIREVLDKSFKKGKK